MDCTKKKYDYCNSDINSFKEVKSYLLHYNLIAVFLLILATATTESYANGHELDSLEQLLAKPTLTVYQKVDILNLLSRTYLYVSSEKAIEYGNRALALSIEQNYKTGLAYAYRNLAGVYSFMGDFVVSAKYVKNALRIFEEQRDSVGIANCYISLGHMYRFRKNHIREIFYHKKSYELFGRLNIDDRTGVAAHNLGESYFNNHEYEKARELTATAIRINESVENLPVLSSCYKVMGLIHYHFGDKTLAEFYFNRVIDISGQLGSHSQKVALATSLLYLSYIEESRGNYKAQLDLLKQSIQLARASNLDDIIRESYFKVIEFYSGIGDKKLTQFYLMEYSQVLKQLGENRDTQTDQLTQAMMEGIDSELETERLNHERVTQNKLIKERNIQLFILITALLVVSFMVLVIININRKLKDSVRHLNELVTFKNKVYSVLLHDLKSPFRFILSNLRTLYFHLQKRKEQDYPLVYEILQSTTNVYKFMDEFQGWVVRYENINQDRALVNMNDLLAEIVEFYAPIAANGNNLLVVSEQEELVFKARLHSLKIVLRNFIDNALKHVNNGKITLSTFCTSSYLCVTIEDTGSGMTETTVKTILDLINSNTPQEVVPNFNGGFGYSLIAEYLRAENALMCIDSELNIGTKVVLAIPR